MSSLDPRYARSPNVERASSIRVGRVERGLLRPLLNAGLSVIVLNRDKPEFILPLVRQLSEAVEAFSKEGKLLKVVFGDTGSVHPEVLAAYRALPHGLCVVENLCYHFSKNNTLLAESIDTEHVLFLNNDVHFSNPVRSFSLLYEALVGARPLDILGASLRFASGTCQHAGVYFSRHQATWALPYHLGSGDAPPSLEKSLNVPALTGAFLAMRLEDFQRLGGFEDFYRAECQDVDLCLKARRLGGECTLLNLGEVVHYENGTRVPGEANLDDRSVFLRRWQGFVEEAFLLKGETR